MQGATVRWVTLVFAHTLDMYWRGTTNTTSISITVVGQRPKVRVTVCWVEADAQAVPSATRPRRMVKTRISLLYAGPIQIQTFVVLKNMTSNRVKSSTIGKLGFNAHINHHLEPDITKALNTYYLYN